MKNKASVLFLVIILMLPFISGCGHKKDIDNGEYTFTAEIIEINNDSVLVQPFGEGDGISGVDKVLFSTTNLPELDIKIGSKIKVSYNGQVMYSLPAQINPLSWQLLE